MKIRVGDRIDRSFTTVKGETVHVPNKNGKMIHMQFRRWEGCPICNTHLAEYRMNQEKIERSGIEELILFHSKASDIADFQNDLPFNMVGDPKKEIYKRFGVESSWLKFLSPKALIAAFKSMLKMRLNLRMTGNGPHGLPADILVDSQGRVVAVKYGNDAYDQWSVSELVEIANSNRLSVRV